MDQGESWQTGGFLPLKPVLQYASKVCNSIYVYKWGCDGSQHIQFKQKFENSHDSDANIFQSFLVPIQLISRKNKDLIVWKNPTPSSPRYCRPIRIRFIHETADVTNEEIGYINKKFRHYKEQKFQEQRVIYL